MSAVLESLRKSSINIQNISKTLSDTKKSTSSVNDSVENISRIVATNTRVKRELFTRSDILSSRREEASKRQELEDRIESTRVSTSPQAGLAFSSRSEKGPLGRLLGFLGFITAGWIVENLPTWIFMGQEFISRIQTFGRSMYNMVGSMQVIMKSFGDTLGYSLDSILRLDFAEFSGEGSVARSFEELNLAVQDLGTNITDTFKLFTTPLTESLETGEQAPGLEEKQPDTMFPGVQQETAGSPMRTVAGIHKQALDIIAGPESGGNYNAMNQGTDKNGNIVGSTMGGKTSKDIIGKNLTDMTIGEVMDRQNERKYPRNARPDLGIHAAGKYQIIGITLPGAMKGAGLKPSDKFSPENQDKLGLAVLKSQGIGAWTSGGSRYSAKETAIIKQAQRTPVTFTPPTPQTPPPSPTGQPQTSNLSGYRVTRNGRSITSLGQLPPHHGSTRTTYGGNRLRQDFTLYKGNQFLNIPVPSPVSGTINFSGSAGAGGNWVEIQSSQGLVELGHFNSLKVKKGDKVSVGTILGLQGYTGRVSPSGVDGTHVHIQAPDAVVASYISMLSSGKIPYAPVERKEAQISAQPKAQQPAAMTPERKGSQMLFIDATQPQAPQTSYPSQQQPSATPTISEFKLLNNFIKNKLLLDLAYL
jgi:hypothetical protein